MSGEYGFQPVNFTLVTVGAQKQYHIAAGSGNYCSMAATKTGVLVGIVQNEPAATGESASICPFGMSKVIAGAAISVGARITCNASGRAAAAGSGDTILGYAKDAAAADGDVISAFIVAAMDKMIS